MTNWNLRNHFNDSVVTLDIQVIIQKNRNKNVKAVSASGYMYGGPALRRRIDEPPLKTEFPNE